MLSDAPSQSVPLASLFLISVTGNAYLSSYTGQELWSQPDFSHIQNPIYPNISRF